MIEKILVADRGETAIRALRAAVGTVRSGERVSAGQAVASIEAMQTQAAVTSPDTGRVVRLAAPRTQKVDAGDLLVVVEIEE
jgi:pyruvate carboxylase